MALGGVGVQECLQARFPKGRKVFHEESAGGRVSVGEASLNLEEGDAKGVEVGGGRWGFTTDDFRGEVLRCAGEESFRGLRGEGAEAEVDEDEMVVRIKEAVGGFDIAMKEGIVVEVGERRHAFAVILLKAFVREVPLEVAVVGE